MPNPLTCRLTFFFPSLSSFYLFIYLSVLFLPDHQGGPQRRLPAGEHRLPTRSVPGRPLHHNWHRSLRGGGGGTYRLPFKTGTHLADCSYLPGREELLEACIFRGSFFGGCTDFPLPPSFLFPEDPPPSARISTAAGKGDTLEGAARMRKS